MIELLIWVNLFMIGISDVKEHRIPNKLLIVLIILITLESLIRHQSGEVIVHQLLAGILMFVIGLFLFFLRAMAAGDVKLLGVIGFMVGFYQLQSMMFWVIIAAGFIGVLYAFYNKVEPPKYKNKSLRKRGKASIASQEAEYIVDQPLLSIKKTVMPFAPAVVVGLAMHHYFLLV